MNKSTKSAANTKLKLTKQNKENKTREKIKGSYRIGATAGETQVNLEAISSTIYQINTHQI